MRISPTIRSRTLRFGVPVLVAVLVVSYFGVSYLIASGVTRADRNEQDAFPEDFGLMYEDVSFVSRKGDVTLEGWYIPGRRDAPTLIFVHGINSVRSGDNAVELAARLVDRGFNALLFDQRAHGLSGGDQTSYGYYERLDMLGALDFLIARGVDKEDVGLIGFSMGAGTALLGAAEEPGLRAVVADSPYAVASDLIVDEVVEQTSFPAWFVPVFVPGAKLVAQVLFSIDIGAMAPKEAVAGLEYPVFIVHGMDDTRIPTDHGVRVHAAALNPESELWLVPGTEHVDAFLNYPEEYESRVADYFAKQLNACNVVARVTC